MAEFAPGGPRGGQLRPGRPAAGAHGATSRSRSAALVRGYRVLETFAADAVKPSPILTGLQDVPVRAADRRQARARRPRRRRRRLRHRRAARGHAAVHPRGARRGARRRSRPTRSPRACPSCARRSRPGSRAASAPTLDPDTEVLPTLGSKEAIFHLAPGRRRRLRRRHRRPATRSPSAAPRSRASRCSSSPLRAERGFLPDLDAVDAATWDRTAILWLNYPNNPTAASAPLELYEQAAEIAREHDVVVASDEAYSEIYFGEMPPVSALRGHRPPQRDRVSTRSPSAPRCPATAPASWPATPT